MNMMMAEEQEKYKNNMVAFQEISADMRQLTDTTVKLYSKEYFINSDATLRMHWGNFNKPWIFTAEGVDDPILKKEKYFADRYIRRIPENRIKDYNFSKRSNANKKFKS